MKNRKLFNFYVYARSVFNLKVDKYSTKNKKERDIEAQVEHFMQGKI